MGDVKNTNIGRTCTDVSRNYANKFLILFQCITSVSIFSYELAENIHDPQALKEGIKSELVKE